MQADFHARQKMAHKNVRVNCKNKLKVTVHSAPFAKPRFQRSPLLRSSFLLMKWRSLRTFMQADFHASMKSTHKNVRVNSKNKLKQKNEKFTQIGVDRYNSKCYTNACRFDRETFEHEKHGKCLLLRRQKPFWQSFLSTTVEKPDEKKNKKVVDKQKTT